MATLVAYFSATGTTERVADTLAEAIGADSFRIVPQTPYTAADLNWNNPTSRSSIEMKDDGCRPPIFIGFPIWWYQAPRIIETFLESYDFSGKTIILFATSGGSGLGDTEAILKPLCADARWLPGRMMNGVGAAAMRQWVESLGV